MNYLETIDYLFAQLPMFHRVGASAYKADLSNTVALCNVLDNPQNAFKTIHVTGTNGKGSVSHMLASILQTKGLNTGLYTSPHLKDFRERIRVNGKMITKSYVTRFIEKYQPLVEKIQPSFFELTVAMAFQYFREKKVDIAVIEVGLGGRLDSTNIIHPLLSVITNVSFDHIQFLGNTLEHIAMEKAGIIKPGIPVVIGETRDETRKVFIQKAAECNAPILFADTRYSAARVIKSNQNFKHQYFQVYRDGRPLFPNLSVPLLGLYQKKNIITVTGACDLLNEQGLNINPETIRSDIAHVIKNTGFAGRWQILGRNPLTICDTGHNEGGLKEVLIQISETPHHHLHLVIGFVNDKHLDPILKMLPVNATYYFCKPNIPRGLDATELQEKAHRAGLSGEVYPSVITAMKSARTNAGKTDLVFVGGSTFVVAEVV